jgi:CubicO group peptidase (beta-lactamase class C family)
MKLKHKIISLISLLLIFTGCATTKPPPEPKNITKGDYTYVKQYMRRYINEQMKKNNIVGLSVALVDDQQIVWQEGFGYADKANKIKATPKTRYRAGSITKLFNAMAVMKLAEEGKMDIDKPLKTYLPEFSIKSRFGSTDGITPRNIMTHHSGLPADWIDRMFATNPLPYTEHVKLIKNEYTSYPPNTIFSYSNLGITLLGHAVEKVAGESYSSYLDKILLKPLGMNDSDLKMKLSKNGSKSYHDGKETIEYAIGEIPAGALNTTVTDLSKFAMMLNQQGKIGNREVLQSSSLKQMFEVQNRDVKLDVGEKIGLAWFINDTTLPNQEHIYHHGGGTIAHRSLFGVAPKSKLGVVVLSNSASANSEEIAKTLLKKAWEAKMAEKIPNISNKYIIQTNEYDLEGTYASILGKVDIEKKSQAVYVAHTTKGNFKFRQQKDKGYYGKYLLFGLIPIANEKLDKIRIWSQKIEKNTVIVADFSNHRLIAGLKVKPTPISKAWKQRLGSYEIINQLEPKEMQIKKITAKIEDGFLLVETETNSGDKKIDILRVINDNEAIIEGLGKGKQETVYVKDGILHYMGLRFRRIE